MEVDQLHCEHYTDGIFSTHDLSWRSTVSCEFNPNSFRFSTHDLSWRSTTVNIHCRAAEFFQLTTSRGGRQILEYIQPQGGIFSTHDLSWRSTIACHVHLPVIHFSTHDLSWRSTRTHYNRRNFLLVQLTTSRGGRREHIITAEIFFFFNSRPLVEVDCKCNLRWDRYIFSTHDLSWRSTLLWFTHGVTERIFQLTTSRGGRPSCSMTVLHNLTFQLTTSRGGRQQNFTINH